MGLAIGYAYRQYFPMPGYELYPTVILVGLDGIVCNLFCMHQKPRLLTCGPQVQTMSKMKSLVVLRLQKVVQNWVLQKARMISSLLIEMEISPANLLCLCLIQKKQRKYQKG